ncbi:MAG TPA: hypothetical protein HPQ04_14325 [Rhodospirillaceae bacterium]|nr:hypothetical protein [Rhodospirillaceae bacterium]
MLFPTPQRLLHHFANAAGALLVGAMFAVVGLNAASGCGQTGGQCIGVHDLTQQPQWADRSTRSTG